MKAAQFDAAMNAVSAQFGIARHKIAGPCRERPIAFARWAVCIILHGAGWKMAQIARRLTMHHTSVRHALAQEYRLPQGDLEAARLLFSGRVALMESACQRLNKTTIKPLIDAPASADDVWQRLIGNAEKIF